MNLSGPKALSFCARPSSSHRIALLHGEDSGLVAAAADQLATAWAPAAEAMDCIRLFDDDLRKSPARLMDELCARSLLGGERIVRLRLERSTHADAVVEVLSDIDRGCLIQEAAWIVEAGSLKRTAALRKAFEASPSCACLLFYPDTEETIAVYIRERLRGEDVAIGADGVSALATAFAGDRRLASAELEKLSLYAMALGRALTIEDVEEVCSSPTSGRADEAADGVLAGDASALATLEAALDAGASAISVMRVLHGRLLRLLEAVTSLPSTGMQLRPPVFDRDWTGFRRTMSRWSTGSVLEALASLRAAEARCKQAGAPGDAILRALWIDVLQKARASARS